MGVYGMQVRCLITTGQRVSQILNFDPKWIHRDTIVFPAGVMKSGIEHTIPLGKLTASLLPQLQVTTYQGKPKRKLDEKSGVLGWTLHDIRRVFSSGMASVGVPQHITERLIDHTTDSHVSDVAAIYNLYNYMPEMRQAIAAWEEKLQTILQS
jgi:integrase